MPRRKIYNKNIVRNRSKLKRRRVNNMPKHNGKTSYASILKIISSLMLVSAILFATFYYIAINPIEIKPVKLAKETPTTNIVTKTVSTKENIFKNKDVELQAHLESEDITPQKTAPIIVEKIENIIIDEEEIQNIATATEILNNQNVKSEKEIKIVEKEEKPTKLAEKIKAKISKAKTIVDNIKAKAQKTNEKEIHKLYEEPVDNNMIVVEHAEDIKKLDNIKHKTFKIAVVIDDMGINRKRSKDIAKLNYPITSSYMSYARDIPQQVKIAQDSGHQIIIHVPMQPKGKHINAGPNVITQGMPKEKIAKILNHSIDLFPMAEGINNHMGSKLTESKAEIDEVMRVLSKRGLFFLDSKTTNKSVCRGLAEKYNVKYIARNTFIDNVDNKEYVLAQLRKTVSLAKKNGYAIAIGHPKKGTVEALKVWLPKLKAMDVEVVHINDLLPK